MHCAGVSAVSYVCRGVSQRLRFEHDSGETTCESNLSPVHGRRIVVMILVNP
jgi:hypothetical protein